jgi:hypothetical protein
MQVSLGLQATTNLKRYSGTPDRELFYYLINSDEYRSVLPRAKQLLDQYFVKAKQLVATDQYQSFEYSAETFEGRIGSLLSQRLAPVRLEKPLSEELLKYVLLQQAPSALLDGSWLQNISLAANNHSEITASLFDVYAKKIGDGESRQHLGNLYRDMLRNAHVYLPEVNSRLFTTHADFQDVSFQIPTFQLALSLFSRPYLPELMGYTLGHFVTGQATVLLGQVEGLNSLGFGSRYCQYCKSSSKASEIEARVLASVMTYLEGIEDASLRQEHWQRVWSGLVLYSHLNLNLQNAIIHHVETVQTKTPHQKMIDMVIAKAPHARNMHRNKRFGKRLINDWFADEPFDAEGFLSALIASPYVNLKSPEKSQLITRSIDFGGPMFRIFTDEEQVIMEEWVHSLAEDSSVENGNTIAPVRLNKPDVLPPAKLSQLDPDLTTYAQCKKRDLYYYFVNADTYPDVIPTARRVAQQFFKDTVAAMNKKKLPELQQFFVYSHDAFESRIRNIYQSETNSYETLVGDSTVPREIMVWFTQQYAAFTMVDGSWVQSIAKAGASHTEISARLFRIYSDEVGNADTFMNHPNVYRRLLEGEGIHMPPTASREFAMQPELLDFAFDLPLLTLSISMFPKAMLPEIIGVNLGIELSGLGKDYMTIIDELKYWKIDPYFFTLHLTIDNIASGHTAMAMETVHLYLDQVLSNQGYEAMQRDWERIWIGYLAFTRVAKKFETTLEQKAVFKFMGPLLRLKMKSRNTAKSKPLAKA